MDLKKLEVQELLNLDDIESEEMLYLKKYGYFPFNVSTWNPSSYFSQKFLDHQLELMVYWLLLPEPTIYLQSHILPVILLTQFSQYEANQYNIDSRGLQ